MWLCGCANFSVVVTLESRRNRRTLVGDQDCGGVAALC